MTFGTGASLTWLGHAAFRIESPKGKVILTDPFLEGNPSAAAVEPPDRVDIILPSHGHSDNLGDTLAIARRTGAKVYAIFEIAQWLSRQGLQAVVGMNMGGTVEEDGIAITMTPAWHSSSIMDGEQMLPGGTACGFVIRLEDGYTIYFSGDTDVFLDMQLIAKLHQPDLALLSIGDHFTMGPKGAAEAIRLLGVHHVIPMHHGTFPVLTGTPEKLREESADIEGLEIHALKPGETLR